MRINFTQLTRYTRVGTLILLTASALSLSGCIAAAVTGAAAAGGAGVAYVTGTLRADMQATPTRLAEATRRAFGTYVIKVDEYRTTELDSVVTGHTANDKKIKVTVKRKTDNISELSIHVGTFGDEAFSNLLYEEIKRQLSQGGSNNSSVATYAVPMAAATPAPVYAPASPTLEPASSTNNAPSSNSGYTGITPAPSSGTPVAH